VKRIAYEARAAGEGNIYDATLPLPWPLRDPYYKRTREMASDQETTGRILAGFPDSVPIDELQESVQEQASLQMHAATYFTQDLRSRD